MSKFYPMKKTESIRDAISTFRDKVNEEFHETWERFHDLLLKCPQHGFDKVSLVHLFYKGLSPMNRTMIDSMHKGKFKDQTLNQAYTFLEELAESARNWNSSSEYVSRNEYTLIKKPCMYEVKTNPDLKYIMESLAIGVQNLSKKFDAFTISTINNPSPVLNVSNPCGLCSRLDHATQGLSCLLL